MSKLTWFGIAGLLAIIALSILLRPATPKRPLIKDGILDLREHPLQPEELIPLRGEWRFQKLTDGELSDPIMATVPGYWNNLEIDGTPLGARAIGRYELKVLVDLVPINHQQQSRPPGPPQGMPPQGPRPGNRIHAGPITLLFPSPFGAAYFIGMTNAPPLSRSGVINREASTSQGGYAHSSTPLPMVAIQNDTLTLFVDIANHHSHFGGLYTTPLLGYQDSVERFEFWWTLSPIFVGSILLGFSLFCFGLYLIFTDRRLLLYASLFSLACIVRLLFSDALPIRFLSTSLPFNLVASIRFMTIPIATLFIGLYILSFSSHTVRFSIGRFLKWSTIVIVSLVIILPPFPKSYVIYLNQAYVASVILVLMWLMLWEYKQGKKDVSILLLLSLFSSALILLQLFNFYGEVPIRSPQTYSLLIIIAGMALMILKDVTSLNVERNQLTVDLKSANQELSSFAQSLTTKVEERTSELAQRNEELEALQRFRRRMNAMIVHDLKNPLQVILSRSSSSAKSDQRIHNAGRRMLMMIQNMLDIDLAEQATLVIRPEQFSLLELAQSAVDRQGSFIAEKNVQLSIEINTSIKILSDRILTDRVVDNILHNAIKYTPNGGQIRLHTSQQDGLTLLHCDDSGPGIPEELREKIFTDYNTDRSSGDAYGLGLSFVRTAMQAIGGRVEVSTPEQGSGGRFLLYFPAVAAAEAATYQLKEKDMQLLAPYLPRLRATEHYAATTIEAILETIPDQGGIPGWKQAIQEAMYAGNETKYRQLLDHDAS